MKQKTLLCQQRSVSQSYGFPLVMYGCESWTIKKVEHRRTDAFELWCWRRLLRVPWTAKQGRLEERWRQDPLGSTIGEPKTRRSVQLLSRVRLFVTPWTAALQASLSITISQRLLKLVHRVSDAIQPSHLLSSPSPHAFNLSQHQGLFQ